MKISLTISDATPHELARLVAFLYPERVAINTERGAGAIDEADRPDAGVTYPSGAPEGVSAEAAFGAVLSPEAAFAGTTGNGASDIPAGPAPIAAGPVGTSPAPTLAPGASVELDSRGLPWDARIHAKGGNGPGGVKNADGSWRAKRGVNDAALVASVEAELRQALGAPAPTVAAVPVPPAQHAAQVFAASVGNVPAITPVPPVPTAAPVLSAPIASPPAAPAAPAVGGQLPVTGNYIELVTAITGWVKDGKLNEAEVSAACMAVGIPSLPLLATRLDLVASVSAVLNQTVAPRL